MTECTKHQSKISATPMIFGLPALVILAGIAVSFALAHYVYPALFGYIALTLVVAYIWRRHLLKSEHVIIRMPNGGEANISKLLVRGVSSNILEEIFTAINNNQLVIVHAPKNKPLRAALTETIYRKGGFSKFRDANRLYISSEPLGERVLLLSYGSKAKLQSAMSHLMARGWTLHGKQDVERSLFDRVYTQTMLYQPQQPEHTSG